MTGEGGALGQREVAPNRVGFLLAVHVAANAAKPEGEPRNPDAGTQDRRGATDQNHHVLKHDRPRRDFRTKRSEPPASAGLQHQ